jgi:hypothetical protein
MSGQLLVCLLELLPWGASRIYPNMFIFLIGPSGVGKGEAMKPATGIFDGIKLPVAAEAITCQELSNFMGKQEQSFINELEKSEIHSSITVFSKELSVLLGQQDLQLLSWLTDWYDSHELWRYQTRNKGHIEIPGVCLNILGATAPDWIKSMIPLEAMGGGFTSRVIFVVEERKNKVIPYPIYNEKHIALKEKLTEDLSNISRLKGVVKLTDDAKKFYIDFYTKTELETQNGNPPLHDPHFEGYCNRRPLHLRKIAMLMSVSRSDDLIIELKDFERALRLLEMTEVNMTKVFGGIGRSDTAEVLHILQTFLLNEFEKHKRVPRSKVLKELYRDIDMQTLQILESTLVESKFITSELEGADVYYKKA